MMKKCVLILTIVSMVMSCSDQKSESPLKINVIENPTIDGSRYPYLGNHGERRPTMSWFSPSGDGYQLKHAQFQGEAWTATELIHESDSFFVNWADFPSIHSFEGQPVVAHWLKKIEGGTYAYNVEISFRNADGSWTDPIVPHSDGTPTEHGFVSMIALDQDRVFAVWLDGRNMKGMSHDEMEKKSELVDLSTAMTLRSAIIHRDGKVSNEHEIDNSVCECCQTAIAKSNNNIIVVYRNRTQHEIRDIYYALFNSELDEWSEPQSISNDGWEIGGCPVNGPQISAHGDRITAVWFTGANNESRSFMARSIDGGQTFSDAVQIDNGTSMGRVGVLDSSDGNTWLSWVGAGENSAKIYVRRIDIAGNIGEAISVAEIDPSRGSGFPKLAETDGAILMAWTSPRPTSKINTILINTD